MAQIQVSNLTFAYEGSFDNIFENVSFTIDSDWKTGFIGRNGKGKTTFLNLLLGRYEYSGSIRTNKVFDYFPYETAGSEHRTADELMSLWKPDTENWRVMTELSLLDVSPEVLYRPIETLSFGERTKVMLAVLFSGENDFLLIDEPTNHLDMGGREIVKRYLAGKKGFILVSHDRDLLDACVDHVLVLNRTGIEVQAGNFSSWQANKEKLDAFHLAENEKHLREIGKLKEAADRNARWAEKNESTKIGFDPVAEHDRFKNTRSYIGAKTKAMQSRVKNFEKRIGREIEEKEGLLNDIEEVVDLKLMPMEHYKDRLIHCRDFSLRYRTAPEPILRGISFELCQGDRLFVCGDNGCGKSSLIKAILKAAGRSDLLNCAGAQAPRSAEGGKAGAGSGAADGPAETLRGSSGSGAADGQARTLQGSSAFGAADGPAGTLRGSSGSGAADGLAGFVTSGQLETASNLVISYISQDTSHLSGSLKSYAEANGLDYTLFLSLLRQLDLERVQFFKDIREFSQGQKKKVLIAASLLTSAHLYIWDEPLNYIDVFSRMQIEKLIKDFQPTMILVEHDVRFRENLATKVLEL